MAQRWKFPSPGGDLNQGMGHHEVTLSRTPEGQGHSGSLLSLSAGTRLAGSEVLAESKLASKRRGYGTGLAERKKKQTKRQM